MALQEATSDFVVVMPHGCWIGVDRENVKAPMTEFRSQGLAMVTLSRIPSLPLDMINDVDGSN